MGSGRHAVRSGSRAAGHSRAAAHADGCPADTDRELRRAGGSGEAVSAIDATFSAPKSVSAVWALADRHLRADIERAHEAAIDRALHYAIRQVPMLRRRISQDTVLHEKASGLIATSWRHTTARAVDGQVPDPQLHSHVLLHGAVRRDGRVVAIDSRAWLVHQREVGAAYRTELARELGELGLSVRHGTGRGGRYFELGAIPQPLLDRWSSRHHQVHAAIRQRLADQERELKTTIAEGGAAANEAAIALELLRQTGQLSPAQERLMGTVTRSAKTPVTVADLDAEWRRTALTLGISRERIEVLRHQHIPTLPAAAPREVLDALTEFDGTFPARDARAAALERSAGAPIDAAREQLRELRARDEILVLADGTGTTRQHRGRERTVVAIAQRLAAGALEPLPATMAAREADRLDRELARTGGRLSDEQRAAIKLACGNRPLVVIEGQAGTGKSTTLTGVARTHQAAGQEILVTSTAALAAERLARELAERGVRCEAYSTAALQPRSHTAASPSARTRRSSTTRQRSPPPASSSGSSTPSRPPARASSPSATHSRTSPSAPAGCGATSSRPPAITAHVELTRNQRARDPGDRRDQALFRAGHAERAIRGYAAREHVHLHHDPRRTEDQALDAAHGDRANGKTTIVIAQTSNDHLDALNARAQAIRHQAGQLGDDGLPIPGRPYELHEGDLVQVRRTLQHPDHGPLRNGTAAQITAVHPEARALELRLDGGAELTLTKQQTADADLRLAYVQHPFPAQGQTTDTTHLIIGERATREGSYIGLTRARESTEIYAAERPDPTPEYDRLQDLAQHMSHTEPDLPSIRTPLSHDAAVATIARIETLPSETHTHARELTLDSHADGEQPIIDMSPNKEAHALSTASSRSGRNADASEGAQTLHPDHSPRSGAIPVGGQEEAERPARIWPRERNEQPLTLTLEEGHDPEYSVGLET